MKRTVLRVLAGAAALFLLAGFAHAQSPLGIGTSEPSIAPAGPFPVLVQWVNMHQQAFYRALTAALKGMREDGGKLWLLVGLSFAYGVFHAAGPGHGKAVISSYMLANEVALRRGVVLSFLSAMLQAVSAVLLMALVFLVLRGTAVSMTDATWFMEIASYLLIAAFGAWLLWAKLKPLVSRRPASLSMAQAGGHHHDHHHGHSHGYHHGPGEACAACGHSHAPDPALLSGRRLDPGTAWSAVVAVGLRPCSGALIVLTFAFLNGLYAGGILAVFAMALGTAITVSLLATLAVMAKGLAVRLSGGGRAGALVHSAFEIGGALLVLLLGLVLLAASLQGVRFGG